MSSVQCDQELANSHVCRISFEYKGQTSTLQSPAEITAWIAERKKRFPTKARAAEAAERKKQNEEAQRLARQAAKESQERRRAEAKERQEKSKAEAKEKRDKQEAAAKEKRENSKETGIVQHVSGDKDDAALRAKLKVEKLRRRLEKEERRIAKAEAKAARNTAEARPTTESSNQHQSLNNKKRKRTDSLESSGMKGGEVEEVSTRAEPTESILKVGSSALQIAVNDAVAEEAKVVMIAANAPINSNNVERDTAQNPLTPTSQPSILDIEHRTPPPEPSRNHLDIAAQNDAAANNNTVIEANTSDNPNLSLSITSSDISSGSDYDSTSSSGSSSSSSSPSDSDAAPETAPSKPPNPARVPPPKRRKAKTENVICRNFLRNGRCARGEKCHFKHELPEKGSLSKAERRQAREVKAKAREGKKERERKGLYQRVSAVNLYCMRPRWLTRAIIACRAGKGGRRPTNLKHNHRNGRERTAFRGKRAEGDNSRNSMRQEWRFRARSRYYQILMSICARKDIPCIPSKLKKQEASVL